VAAQARNKHLQREKVCMNAIWCCFPHWQQLVKQSVLAVFGSAVMPMQQVCSCRQTSFQLHIMLLVKQRQNACLAWQLCILLSAVLHAALTSSFAVPQFDRFLVLFCRTATASSSTSAWCLLRRCSSSHPSSSQQPPATPRWTCMT
jgi:hypothetical protein